MEEVKTKVCPKCGEEKPLTDEFWSPRSDKKYVAWRPYCKKCNAKLSNTWWAENKTRSSEKNKEWRKLNYDIVKNYHLKYRKSDGYKKHKKQNAQRATDGLKDRYIKSLLRYQMGIEENDITPELIELKRQQILMLRLFKQFTKEGLSDEFSSAEVNGNQRDVGEVQEKRGYSGGGTGVCLTC